MSNYPPNPPQPPTGPPEGSGQYGQPDPYGQSGQSGYGQAPGYGQPAYGAPGGAPVAGGTRPGELLERFLARLIDGVIVGIVFFVLSLILGAILISDRSVNLSTGEVEGGGTAVYSIIYTLITTAISVGYFALLESSRGQTIGKMALKLRVVAPGGGNPTLVQAAKRNIWLAIGLVGILGFIGSILNLVLSIAAIVLIVIGINSLPDRRTWFDKFGGDLQVVKTQG